VIALRGLGRYLAALALLSLTAGSASAQQVQALFERASKSVVVVRTIEKTLAPATALGLVSARGVFAPLRDVLITRGDHYMHLADLRSYLEADQRLVDLYADPDGRTRKAILNVAAAGKFSSDRTIAEYAADIWHVEPCPVS
jgi:glucan phosphorylase